MKNCAWERIASTSVGLAAWVQRCDHGFRKIDFLFQESGALLIRFSDGGAPAPVVEVFGQERDELALNTIRRVYKARTDAKVAARCVLAPYHISKAPPGVKRFAFYPNPSYRKELRAKQNPNEVPEPPCGDWGVTPDGIQYFEVHPASKTRRVLFVRVGQELPLFDEKTLQLIGTP